MSKFVVTIPKDFDWDSEDGELMNLLLNISGGLDIKYLTEEEKSLLIKHGINVGNENAS